jgi:iron(III) transport system permease protein
MARPDLQSLLRIVLPLSAPSLLTGAGIVFLLSILDYSVPSLLEVHVYAMEIFAEFSASNSPERAFVMAMPLLLLAVCAIAAILKPLRALTLRAVLHRPTWSNPPRWPHCVTVLQWAVGLLLVAQALSPFIVTISLGGAARHLASTVAQAWGEAVYSLWTSGLGALLSLPLALLAARSLLHAGPLSGLRWLLVIAPLAIPASLVGIGLIILSNRPGLNTSAVTAMMPALVGTTRFTPLATLVLLAQLRRTDALLFDAAKVFQSGWFRRQFQVSMPLLAPGFLVGAGVIFALSMGELGATLMVIPPGHATLTLRIYNYLHYGASDTVAGLCLALAAGVLIAGAVAAGAAALWSRLLSAPEAR